MRYRHFINDNKHLYKYRHTNTLNEDFDDLDDDEVDISDEEISAEINDIYEKNIAAKIDPNYVDSLLCTNSNVYNGIISQFLFEGNDAFSSSFLLKNLYDVGRVDGVDINYSAAEDTVYITIRSHIAASLSQVLFTDELAKYKNIEEDKKRFTISHPSFSLYANRNIKYIFNESPVNSKYGVTIEKVIEALKEDDILKYYAYDSASQAGGTNNRVYFDAICTLGTVERWISVCLNLAFGIESNVKILFDVAVTHGNKHIDFWDQLMFGFGISGIPGKLTRRKYTDSNVQIRDDEEREELALYNTPIKFTEVDTSVNFKSVLKYFMNSVKIEFEVFSIGKYERISPAGTMNTVLLRPQVYYTSISRLNAPDVNHIPKEINAPYNNTKNTDMWFEAIQHEFNYGATEEFFPLINNIEKL